MASPLSACQWHAVLDHTCLQTRSPGRACRADGQHRDRPHHRGLHDVHADVERVPDHPALSWPDPRLPLHLGPLASASAGCYLLLVQPRAVLP
jgi:hypothetical protein